MLLSLRGNFAIHGQSWFDYVSAINCEFAPSVSDQFNCYVVATVCKCNCSLLGQWLYLLLTAKINARPVFRRYLDLVPSTRHINRNPVNTIDTDDE